MFSVKNKICLHKHRYSTWTGSLLENDLEFLEMRLSVRNSENYLEFLEMRLSIPYVFGQNKICLHKLRGTCTGSLLENYLEFLKMRLSISNVFSQKKRSYLHKHRYSTCTGSLLENYLEFLEMGLSISYAFRSKNKDLPEQAQI